MIPTAITGPEAAALREIAAGKTVLEIGALLGFSTVTLAGVASRVVSVDPHEGYPADQPRPTLHRFLENIAPVRDRITVCLGSDRDVFPYLASRSFDVVFIDATGEYEDTRRIMRGAIPLLRHIGTLAVHDCGHPAWPGAAHAIREFSESWCRPYALVDRLAIFGGTWG